MKRPELVVVSKNGFTRTLRVWAPKSADTVVYAHDGQNVFFDEDAVSKKSLRALDILKEINGGKRIAIVGIDCAPSSRMTDYTPVKLDDPAPLFDQGSGGGEDYMDFVQNGVMPYIENRFGFKKSAMIGASAGGSITLAFATRKTSVSAYGVFSAFLPYSPVSFKNYFSERTVNPEDKFYIYTGGGENVKDASTSSEFIKQSVSALEYLRSCNVKDIKMRFDNSGIHSEECWRNPLKEFFELLLTIN